MHPSRLTLRHKELKQQFNDLPSTGQHEAHLLTPAPKAASLICQLGKSNWSLKRHHRNNSLVLHYPTKSSQAQTLNPSWLSEEITKHTLRGNMRVPQKKQLPKTSHPLGKHLPAWQVFKAGIFKLLFEPELFISPLQNECFCLRA